MSRIHYVSTAHAAAEASARAAEGKSDLLFNPLPVPAKLIFDFDLIDHVRSIKSEIMRSALLNSLAFSADAHINAKLGSLLVQFYKSEPAEDTQHPWATYQQFLHYCASLEANKALLTDMGIDAPDHRQVLQALYSMRLECHRLLADGKADYETPRLEDFIGNPRVRTEDPLTYLKWEALAEDEAEGDQDVKSEVLDAYKIKAKAEALAALEWDKQRAQVLVLLLDAFRLTDAERDVTYDDEHHPFDQLPAALQYKMMNGAKRAMAKYIDRAARDRNVETLEFAKLRVERKAYLKTLDAALAHARFDEFRV